VEQTLLAENNSVLQDRLIEIEDDSVNTNTSDITRRRVKSLSATISTLLFNYHGEKIQTKHFKAVYIDASENEVDVCMLICNFLVPYVPSKQSWYSIPYQMQFISMTTPTFAPLIVPSLLQNLLLSLCLVHSMFCN
jgi:hypothetical protein